MLMKFFKLKRNDVDWCYLNAHNVNDSSLVAINFPGDYSVFI